MEDPGDYELQKTDPSPVPVPPRSRERPLALWFATAAGVVILATVAVFFLRREQPRPAPAAESPAGTGLAAPPNRPLGADVEPIELPPLDETDTLVRQLVGALSSHPGVAAWLATNGLIRNFVVVVENISTGRTPAGLLRRLRPTGAFRVVERGEERVIDPGSYERYTPIAGAVQSVDAAGAARLYSTLKPRIEEAYRELGHQESFDRALERAIVALLQVPVPDGNIALASKGALYVYEDPRIERLTAAQKQLARMGPRNVRTIQAKLREVALALGMRVERLPD